MPKELAPAKKRKKEGISRPNNTSGAIGISKANGGWGAMINYQKKRYWLGTYERIEDAILARKRAEEHLGIGFVEWYEKEYPIVNKRRIKK